MRTLPAEDKGVREAGILLCSWWTVTKPLLENRKSFDFTYDLESALSDMYPRKA